MISYFVGLVRENGVVWGVRLGKGGPKVACGALCWP